MHIKSKWRKTLPITLQFSPLKNPHPSQTMFLMQLQFPTAKADVI